ncbi:outer membrane beta-barrel protein [Rhodobacter lacus]|uniref:Outer membrane beta-barrel protein n=1 Tax=Rhodobacter lacus TaxID=1641972 RepID=A0ABW5ACR6_9RHOB
MQDFFKMAAQTALACALVLAPLTASAEGIVTGAEVGLAYSSLADAGARGTHKTTLEGALEYGVTPRFGVQLDLAQSYFGAADISGTAFTTHGIFHADGGLSLGGYLGHEWVDGDDATHYGAEARKSFGTTTVSGQFGKIDTGNRMVTSYGVGADMMLSDQLTLGASYQALDTSTNDMMRADARLGYALPSGVQISGSIGLMDGDGMDTEATFGLGIHTSFGSGRGVSFDRRGLMAFLPGS